MEIIIIKTASETLLRAFHIVIYLTLGTKPLDRLGNQSTESLSDLPSYPVSKRQSQDLDPCKLTLEKFSLNELFCEGGGVLYPAVQYGCQLPYVAIEHLQ